MEWLMTIGQISKLLNVTSETLRHYDRIGLLKPIINEENGYRYYSIKEMEMLDLILDAKYLEIPLNNIKQAIADKSIESYIELIDLQEKTIDGKIEHLLKIKEQAKEKKIILNEMLNFKNNYEFDKLEIVEEEKDILFMPVEQLINGKIKQKDSNLRSLYLEEWMIMFKSINKNSLMEDQKYMGIDEKHSNNLILDYKKIVKKTLKGKFIKVKFVGTIEEVEEYIKSVINYFYKDEDKIDIDISTSWIWTCYNEKGTVNFMEICIPLKND
ncbi:MAG: MerR family DNA-binding transcriptional regulator [Peptostreptococcaceae bacterium]